MLIWAKRHEVLCCSWCRGLLEVDLLLSNLKDQRRCSWAEAQERKTAYLIEKRLRAARWIRNNNLKANLYTDKNGNLRGKISDEKGKEIDAKIDSSKEK